MIYNLICFLHQEKLKVVSDNPAIRANPPQTEQGMIDAHALAPLIGTLGPFDKIYAGRTARTNDAASAVCMHNHWDWETTQYLNQNSSRENGVTVAYPGSENEFYPEWYEMCKDFVQLLDKYYAQFSAIDIPKFKVLAFTSRANLACLWGISQHIVDLAVIKEFARGEIIKMQSIYVFERNTKAMENTFRLLNIP